MENLLFRRLKVVPDMALDSHIIGHYKVSRYTNEALAEDPVLKNVAPNAAEGTDLQLYNFQFCGLSGIGSRSIFTDSFEVYKDPSTNVDRCTLVKDKDKLIMSNITANNSLVVCNNVGTNKNKGYIDGGTARVKVTGIPHGGDIYVGPSSVNKIYTDGVYTIPLYTDVNNYATIGCHNCIGASITFEVLPDYPHSLVFNGTSPIYPINRDNSVKIGGESTRFLDYNVLFLPVQKTDETLYAKNKDIVGEIGETLNINIPPYKLKVSGLIGDQTLRLCYNESKDSGNTYSNYVHFVTNIRNGENIVPNLIRSIIPATENDYCIALLNILMYKKDPILNWTNRSNWQWYVDRATFTVTSNKIHVTKIITLDNFLETSVNPNNAKRSVPYRVRIKGLQDGQKITYSTYHVALNRFEIANDGEYDLPYSDMEYIHNMGWKCNFIGECDITIEQISGYPQDITVECMPVYPAADTKMHGIISSPEMTKVRSMVMDFTPLNLYAIIYDGRTSTALKNIAIYTDNNTIAYIARNVSKTYIDGVKNRDKLVNDILGEDQVIAVNYISTTQNIYIGSNINTDFKSQMAFRQLMLFDRELTEQEIKYITHKMIKERKEEEDDQGDA